MKVDSEIVKLHSSEFCQQIRNAWKDTAIKLGMQHGIFIEVWGEYLNPSFSQTDYRFTQIWFKIGEHRFESLAELKRAIKMKSFL
jgi:hypothetical protein